MRKPFCLLLLLLLTCLLGCSKGLEQRIIGTYAIQNEEFRLPEIGLDKEGKAMVDLGHAIFSSLRITISEDKTATVTILGSPFKNSWALKDHTLTLTPEPVGQKHSSGKRIEPMVFTVSDDGRVLDQKATSLNSAIKYTRVSPP